MGAKSRFDPDILVLFRKIYISKSSLTFKNSIFNV